MEGERMSIVKKVTDEQMKKDSLQIRFDVFVTEQHVDPALEWDEFDHSPSTIMFVDYAEDGTPLATGRLRILADYGKVERICSQKAARGKGSGRRIMEAIEEEAKKQGANKLKLGAQVSAIPFYEKLGYVVCSEIFMDAGIEHKEMEKNI
ncbi:GNAT family N-acetyltransferase [Listeria fleischmannii]|uniref:GNAT family N-acetyltransferase n=2 Tax=Listeria fleischmannii TaxID=1069827 RepID=A0A841YEZ3_9LIST|nr:GNAT family N-acetyltransferase [Listeria fleischmannii]EIA21242.1 acetyltransferase, gnat family protein [Listeria fleischmannii subsp. coloradonensis]MBC1398841.1 GNAT family N-acetyltransferase [Listeria fleischmannii]MBC1427094.1 GNAT family N-acetyltransferase [Listeria fleischmannii]